MDPRHSVRVARRASSRERRLRGATTCHWSGASGGFLLYEDQFIIRWSRPLEDPVIAISNGLTEAPTFYEAPLGPSLPRPSANAGSLVECLPPSPRRLSCFSIRSTRRPRVLSDPVARYLLAERGRPGKTIEAGLVIRQTAGSMMVRRRCLVLCPRKPRRPVGVGVAEPTWSRRVG